MWHGVYGSGWPMVAGGLVFWASIIFLVVWGIAHTTRHQDTPQHYGKSPIEVLKDRYARGEITKTQFDDIKRDLMT
ncbi:SHOCT domain-containing protein [Candidatus Bipolaricaulota bacterium]|nr:SHOCT domain-containing protein [Candidatus Bipolaricaulota bacterium]TFH08463.1 MAG: SHOCT domain-containing protein [Candidatus Atribacteria bacterium]